MGHLQMNRPHEGEDVDPAPDTGEDGSDSGTPAFAGHGFAAQ